MNRREFSQRIICSSFTPVLYRGSAWAAAPATPKFSLMLWVLGKTLSMEQRLEIVASSGYNGGEMVVEWKSWSPEERKRINGKKTQLGLKFDLMFPSLVPLTDPSARAQLLQEVREAIPIAQELGCPQFGLKSGPRVPGGSPEQEKQVIADSLKAAADACAAANMEVLLEPIDLIEDKRQAVNSVAEAFAIARMTGNPKVKVLYDFYHEQRGAGNLIEKLEKNIDLVGLVHIADVPGRHHPGTGEINYPAIYRKLAELHYDRFITMEFVPTGDPVAELKTARQQVISAMHVS